MRLFPLTVMAFALILGMSACGEKKAEEKRAEPAAAAPGPPAPGRTDTYLNPGMGVPPLKESSPLKDAKDK